MADETATVLVVDDEAYVLDSLTRLLASEGLRPLAAESAGAARRLMESEDVDVVVTDLKMPGEDGLSLLRRLREEWAEVPVIVLTGVATVDTAVEAMKRGAFDYVSKPIHPEEFLVLVQKALRHRTLVEEVSWLRGAVRDLSGPGEIIGRSRAIVDVMGLVRAAAPTDATVLILGESGTGKELVAAELHRLSRRGEKPLVRVNCAAIPETLFESEFFGHRKGAFTGALENRRGRFAEAHRGTIVLDEIGTLRPEAQAKLLRVIETGEYDVVGEARTRRADVRVIAITNEDLAARVREGSFREDLYYRLNVMAIHVPPLRERMEDVPLLVEHFIRMLNVSAKPMDGVAREAVELLCAYPWPGNVRELRNAIERALILEPGRVISAGTVSRILDQATAVGPAASGATEDLSIRRRTEQLERELIEEALRRANGRKKQAAGLLGIDYRNFAYYLRKHGM